ncbi:MAG: zinc-ribbon domain-containing protein [Candidatus Cloacimonetes bacterium]|nr:zinc-ribbon domain-containing protein [Candidatus Cloacimonadota bacterium]
MSRKLIKCRTCGKKVSSSVRSCPKCGTLLKLPLAATIITIMIIIFIVGLVLYGLIR